MGRGGFRSQAAGTKMGPPNLSFHWGPSRNTKTPASESHPETDLICLSVAGALKILKAHQVILAYRKFDHHIGSCRCFQWNPSQLRNQRPVPYPGSLGRELPIAQKDPREHYMRDLSLPPSTSPSQPLPSGWGSLRKTPDPSLIVQRVFPEQKGGHV